MRERAQTAHSNPLTKGKTMTTKAARLNIADLTPEARKKYGIKRPRRSTFDKESVRRFAIRCLAEIAELTQQERRRVLEHALKVNKS